MKTKLRTMCSLLIVAFLFLNIFSFAVAEKSQYAGTTITRLASTGEIRDVDYTLAEMFEEDTGIKLDIQVFPSDDYDNIVLSRLMAGDGADLYCAKAGYNMVTYRPEEWAVDLTDEPWINRMRDEVKEMVTYPFGTTLEEGARIYYNIIWGTSERGMLYDTEMFEKYGLKEPTSWEEFCHICDVLLENGIIPIYFEGATGWYCDDIIRACTAPFHKDPDLYKKLNNYEVKWADLPEAVAFFDRMKECADKGYMGEYYMSNTHEATWESLASGEYAMWMGWASGSMDVAAANGSDESRYSMFSVPWTDDFTSYCALNDGATMGIYKNSPNVEACKEWLQWMLEEEHLELYYKGHPDIPVPTIKDVKVDMPRSNRELRIDRDGVPDPSMMVNNMNISGFFGNLVQELLMGNMTSTEVLEALDANRQMLYETNKDA